MSHRKGGDSFSFLRSTSFGSPWASKACTPYPQPAATELRAQNAAANEPADCPARASEEDIPPTDTRPGHVPLFPRPGGGGRPARPIKARARSLMGNLHGQARPRASAGGQGCGGEGCGHSALALFTQNTPRSRELAAERSGLSRSRAGRRAMCRLVHCDCDARMRSLRAACRRDASWPRRDSYGLAGSKSHISNSTCYRSSSPLNAPLHLSYSPPEIAPLHL